MTRQSSGKYPEVGRNHPVNGKRKDIGPVVSGCKPTRSSARTPTASGSPVVQDTIRCDLPALRRLAGAATYLSRTRRAIGIRPSPPSPNWRTTGRSN